MKFSRVLIAAALASTFHMSAYAQDDAVGHLKIQHPYARPTAPAQQNGAAYVTILNTGKSADKLIAVSSPAAKTVEIHSTSMTDNIMRMRQTKEIDLPPESNLEMTPGKGYHLMLVSLTKPLQQGEKVPLTFTFKKAGKLIVFADVETTEAGENNHHQH